MVSLLLYQLHHCTVCILSYKRTKRDFLLRKGVCVCWYIAYNVLTVTHFKNVIIMPSFYSGCVFIMCLPSLNIKSSPKSKKSNLKTSYELHMMKSE